MLCLIHDRRGQSITEFALILPMFIALIFGTLSFLMAFQAKVVVTDAARNAGRLAAIRCGEGDPNWFQATVSQARQSLQNGALAVRSYAPFGSSVQPGQWYVEASCTGAGGFVNVRVYYAQLNLFPPLMWFLGQRGQGANTFVFPLQVGVMYPVE